MGVQRLLPMAGMAFLCALSADASGIFRADAASTAPAPDGQTWDASYPTLQAAADAAFAAGGGEVWVRAGSYTATTNPVLAMRENVEFYGGFNGSETERDRRDWSENPAVIDGQGVRRCVLGADKGVLDGFVVTHGSAADGAGMYNLADCDACGDKACSPQVRHCVFKGNQATGRGGGMCNNARGYTYEAPTPNAQVSPTVADCLFLGNSAVLGGAVCNCSYAAAQCPWMCYMQAYAHASPVLENCVFSGNAAGAGGAVMNYAEMFGCQSAYAYAHASPQFMNCAFSGNSGGGIRSECRQNSYGGAYAAPAVTNCVLWGDTPPATPEISNDAIAAPVVSWSCVQGGYAGTGNISADPLFIGAPDNLRLQAASPCIDAGTTAGAPATDILGVARPAGVGVDMGAYEFNGPWVLGGIVINNDARATTSPAVTLSLNWSSLAASPVTRMRFSDDGAHWTLWEPLAAVRPYTLPGPDSYQTVRVQYRDAAGNLSDRLNDYILLDTAPPTGTIVINGGASATKGPTVTLSLTWSDGTGSGVSRMRFSDDGATWTPWETLKAALPHTLQLPPGGHQTVRVQYRDAAGNYSARYSDYIRLDAP